MKLKNLTLAIIAIATSVASMQANAVYNLYKSNGLSLDIGGEINVAAKNLRQQAEVQYNDGTSNQVYIDATTWAQLAQGGYKDVADRRTRLGQDDGASWLEFRGTQKLNNDWRATGTIGFGYYDRQTGAYLSNANLAIDKLNVGSLSVGRQYLHTGYVARTGTYTTLETFGGASVRLDYTQVPGLHLSGYYNTPSSSDVRTKSTAEVEGWGASASYRHPFGNQHSIRLAAGYSDSRANPANKGVSSNQVPVSSQGYAGSLEYRIDGFLVAADGGKKKEDLNGSVTDSANSDFWGVKVGYQFTPKFSMTAGYGQKDTERTNVANAVVTPYYISGVTTGGTYENMATVYSSFLFDQVKEQKAYVRGDYYLRDNVRVYGRVDKEEIQTKLNGHNFAKLDNTGYRLGLSLTF